MSNSEGSNGVANNDDFFKGVEKYPYKAVSRALEIIPRTLIQNCGGNVVKQLTTLRAKHHQQADHFAWGIDGETGQLVDMNKFGIWEPMAVKMQTIKTAIEVRAQRSFVVERPWCCDSRRRSCCFVLTILSRARRKRARLRSHPVKAMARRRRTTMRTSPPRSPTKTKRCIRATE